MNEWLFTGLNHNIVGNTSSSCHFFIIIICIIIIINSQFIHPIVFHRAAACARLASLKLSFFLLSLEKSDFSSFCFFKTERSSFSIIITVHFFLFFC